MQRFTSLAGLPLFTFVALTSWSASMASAESLKEQVVGKWSVDFEKSSQIIKDERESQVVKQAGDSGLKMTWEFKADGTTKLDIITQGGDDKNTGKWKVLKEDGRVIDIEVIHDDGEDVDKLRMTFLDKDLITITKRSDKLTLACRRFKK